MTANYAGKTGLHFQNLWVKVFLRSPEYESPQGKLRSGKGGERGGGEKSYSGAGHEKYWSKWEKILRELSIPVVNYNVRLTRLNYQQKNVYILASKVSVYVNRTIDFSYRCENNELTTIKNR